MCMKRIILVLLLAVSVSVQAQKTKILVADETQLTMSASTFKIITSNDSIAGLLEKEFRGRIDGISMTQKKDRYGGYWQYTFTFSNDYYMDMVAFIKRINKQP